MGYETLTVECKGRVGWLVNNRPNQIEGPAAFAEKREPRWEPLDPA